MNLAPVIARLSLLCPSLISVEAVTGLNDIDRDEYPVAGVHPLDDVASPSEVVGCIRQEVVDQFGVLIAARAMDPASGIDPLDDIRKEIAAALLGYRNTAWRGPITYVRGDIVAIDTSRTIWRDTYRAETLWTASITEIDA